MTSREIVQRAIRLETPARLPVRFGIFGQDDCGGVPLKPAAGWEPSCEGEDEWGCVWAKTDVPNMGQVTGHPLEDLSGLDSHPMPDYDDDTRYEDVEETLAHLEAQGKYIMVGIFMVLWERMHTLHGFENTLCDLLTDRTAAAALADRILDVHLTLVDNIARRFPGRVHGFGMTDDWGTQQAAFISMDLWRDFFLPRYKRLFDAMHDSGCDVWVHSCGKVNEIIEGYIEAGVNVVNLQQPRALGIEEIGRRYRGRIVLESLADIQHTLPTGDRDLIRADARDLMSQWALPTGGFVFSDYGDGAAIGVHDLQTKVFMYQCFSQESQRLYGEPLPEPTLPEKA
ncbi:MAG: uroporphyrinogen decarboxylase family protein [Armatimonadota bacterium]